MNFFLRIKHWQLFFVFFLIPVTLHFIMIGSLLTEVFQMQMAHDTPPNPFVIFEKMRYYLPVIMFFLIGGVHLWIYSLGVNLQDFLPDNLKISTKKFKFFVLFPPVYMVLFLVFFFNLMGHVTSENPESVLSILPMLFVIVPLHFFSMFCVFYSLYFAAKVIRTVDLQRETKFGDFVGEFFLLWFNIIGIWIIQPKVNRWLKNGVQGELNSEVEIIN